MKTNVKRYLGTGIGLLLAFSLWTVLVQCVDVQPAGPEGTEIGFAAVNICFHQLTGVHLMLYTITDWLEVVPFIICILFGTIGFIQLVKRKSFIKVDYDILILGGYYILTIIGYLVFQIFPVNYRPILLNGKLEASFPSSTTLLVLCVTAALIEQVQRRVDSKTKKKVISILAVLFSAFMVIGRLIAGVHWLTDIAGAFLLSAGLFCIYKMFILQFDK